MHTVPNGLKLFEFQELYGALKTHFPKQSSFQLMTDAAVDAADVKCDFILFFFVSFVVLVFGF